jgi:hypothetical protein
MQLEVRAARHSSAARVSVVDAEQRYRQEDYRSRIIFFAL